MRISALVGLLVGLTACSGARPSATPGAPGTAAADLYASTYQPLPSAPTLIRGGTVMTAAGEIIEGGDVLLRDGRIAADGVPGVPPAPCWCSCC